MAVTRWNPPEHSTYASAKLFHYAPGTSTLKNVYPTRTDAEAATNALAQPVVLNSAGFAQVWLDGQYKLVLKNSAESVTYYTVDEEGDGSDANTLAKNYIAGLTLANAADADHDITVAVGECRDAADTADMVLAAAITKQIDAVWAVGSAAGGLDTGTVGNATMYAVWLIKRTDTGVVDMLFSASFTAPTMPLNYDVKRLVGTVKTNGSANIIAFIQSGDYFRYTGTLPIDVSDAAITTQTFKDDTLSVPPSCLATIYGGVSNPTSTDTAGSLWVRTKGSVDAASFAEDFVNFEAGGITFDGTSGVGMVMVNSARLIEYAARAASGTATVTIKTVGFLMLTRREP